MFPLQNRYYSLVDRVCTILSQFVRLPNFPLFSFTEESYGLAKFYLQDKVRKYLMTFLCSLCPTRFSEVAHGGVIRFFQNLVKSSIIPQVVLKIMRFHICAELLTTWARSSIRDWIIITLSAFQFLARTLSSSTDKISTNLFSTFPEGAS